jgi:hypothetical protein
MKKRLTNDLMNTPKWLLLTLVVLASNLSVFAQKIHRIPNDKADSLEHFMEAQDPVTLKPLNYTAGDIIMLSSEGEYIISNTVEIYAEVTIMGDPALASRPVLRLYDNGFRSKQDSINITIKNVAFNGLKADGINKAAYILRFDDAAFKNYKNILIEDVEAYNTLGGVQLYKNKNTLYESVVLNRVYFHDMASQFCMDPTINAVKELKITNSTFSNVFGVLKNPYFNKDGVAPLGVVAQNIMIDHNTFYNVGGNGGALLQVNDPNDGSVTLNFTNNIVSGVIDPVNARPFLLGANAGIFNLKNNTIFNFESTRDLGVWNLTNILAAQTNVTSVALDVNDPKFKDPTTGSFLLASNSPLQKSALDKGAIGDRKWAGYSRRADIGLKAFIENVSLWNPGDTIFVTHDETLTSTVEIYQEVTIMGDPGLHRKPVLRLYDNGLRAKEDTISITLKNLAFNGLKEDNTNKAAYILRFDQAAFKNYKNILIEDVEAYNTQGGIQLYKNKNTLYESVILNRVYFHDMGNQFCMDPTINAVKKLQIKNSTFANVFGVLKNPYFNKDGVAPLGAVAQNILLDHNTFYNVGGNGGALIQVNDPNDGSVTLNFTNNIVSGVIDPVNARPFLLGANAGTFTLKNNTIHNFESTRDLGVWNLSAIVAAQTNVTSTDNSTDDPAYKNVAAYSFLLAPNSPLQIAGIGGVAIGDPKWAGSKKFVETDLEAFIENLDLWNAGDTIVLNQPKYIVNGSIEIFQSIAIKGDPKMKTPPVVTFKDNGFNVKDDSINVAIVGVDFNGTTIKDDLSVNVASFILRYTGGASTGAYDFVLLDHIHASGFKGGVDLNDAKQRRYKSVVINNVYFEDFTGGNEWVLDPNLNLVEDLKITNSTFSNVNAFLKNVYFNKNGVDVFGTVGQKILVDHNTFYKIGSNNNSLIQLNDQNDGSVDFVFSNNITSTILNEANSRMFRLNTLAGSYKFNNSYFHNFVSSDATRDQFSLDSTAVAFSNVTLTDVTLNGADPAFEAPEMGKFFIDVTSPALKSDGQGRYIGDPRWLPIVPGLSGAGIHPIPNTPDSLAHFMADLTAWNPGDTILLVSAGTYVVNKSIDILQEVTILGDPTLSVRPTLRLFDNGFRLGQDSINVTIKGINFNGLKADDVSKAPYILRFDNATYKNYKNILIEDVDAYNTQGGVQLYKNKNTLYESVVLNRVYFHDMGNQFCVDPSINAVKELKITNSTFANVFGVLKNPYFNKDGVAPLGLVAQNITIDHNTFFNIAGNGGALIQVNDPNDGSVTLNFTNNIVSGVIDPVNSRPFLLGTTAGTFNFSNSTIHNFASTRDLGKYVLDSIVKVQTNVTVTKISSEDPAFLKVDVAPFNFTLPLNSTLIAYGTNGGPIGDPRWFPAVGVSVNPVANVVSERDEVQMVATATFGEGSDLTVTWSVIDAQNGTTGSATIDATTGVLKAVAAGDVKVIAVSNFSAVYSDTLTLTIAPYLFVKTISLVAKSALGTETNQITGKSGSLVISATVLPFDAPDKTITWSVSDASMATITVTNETTIVLTATASGTVKVIATANDGSTVEGSIDIIQSNQRPVTGITVTSEGNATELEIGKTLNMSAAVLPADADMKDVTWSVDKTSIATIDANGVLTAVGAGTVVVKASAKDNSFKSGTLSIVVKAPLGLIEVENLATIFPNPTSQFINVNVEGLASVQVMSLTGQIILTKEVNRASSIDVSSLKSGMYVMRIVSGVNTQAIRFTKQ